MPGTIDGGEVDGPSSEVVATPLSPRIVLLWQLGWLATTAVLTAGALLISAVATGLPAWARVALPALVLAGGLVATVALPRLTYRRWRYAITDDTIELRHGVVIHHETSIPHFRVQHIDIDQGPLDRWRNIVKLTISTASPASDGVLPGIEPDRAEAIRASVLERAEADDGV